MKEVERRQAVLEIEALKKGYRRRVVLRGISLEVGPGEALAVIGPNGAGKSTFFGCISGERLPDSGRIRICGLDPFSDPASAARCMGFVPEQPFLYGELTVAEMMRFVAQARSLPDPEGGARIARLLERFGLAGSEDVLCRELSQGMGRKVAIVAALLHRPQLLVLDEVFNGLDAPSAERLLEELEEHRRNGGAVLLSSHDLPLLARWCDAGLLLAPDGWQWLQGDSWKQWQRAPALVPR